MEKEPPRNNHPHEPDNTSPDDNRDDIGRKLYEAWLHEEHECPNCDHVMELINTPGNEELGLPESQYFQCWYCLETYPRDYEDSLEGDDFDEDDDEYFGDKE